MLAHQIGYEKNPQQALEQLYLLGYRPGDTVYGRLFSKGAEVIGLYPISFSMRLNAEFDGYSLTQYASKKYGGSALSTTKNGVEFLTKKNLEGYNVYFVVNSGGQSDAEITEYKAQFFEIDDIPLADQFKKIKEFSIAPTLVVKTRKSLHTYYRVSDRSSSWGFLQKQLVMSMDADPAIANPSRLMRLAGFQHQKFDPTTKVFQSTPVEIVHSIDANTTEDAFTRACLLSLPYGCSESRWEYWKKLKGQKARGHQVDPSVVLRLPDTLIEAALAPKRSFAYNDNYSSVQLGNNNFDIRQFSTALEGYQEGKRSGWATAKCPVHNGESYDSLHINLTTGAYRCHAGCPSKEISRLVLLNSRR